MPITVTFLELTDPTDIRPPARPPQREYALEPVEDPGVSRWFYERVGANHSLGGPPVVDAQAMAGA